ncbi:MAG: hypothetical protein EXR75_13165 [Myxococcales bacterium]|nr:hypothetical protein [Myxococcales bacterium]
MNIAALIVGGVAGLGLLGGATLSMRAEVQAATLRLQTGSEEPKLKVATADDAEVGYCTANFKAVLARVIHACGLSGSGGGRGCQPADVKTLASIDDADFNALFQPLKERAAVVMFADGSDQLDEEGKKLIEAKWEDRKGARYFFVVARASKTGGVEMNRKLSHRRANSVRFHVGDEFQDPDIDKKVGLLWLGKEFAQLDKDFCTWGVSHPEKCDAEAINRSAFVTWVDCRL